MVLEGGYGGRGGGRVVRVVRVVRGGLLEDGALLPG